MEKFVSLKIEAAIDVPDQEHENRVVFDTKFEIHPDCPPSIITALTGAFTEFAKAMMTPEVQARFSKEMLAIRARTQAQADLATRQLIGEEEPSAPSDEAA